MPEPEQSKFSLPELEEKILKFWEENKIFEKSITQRKKARRFIFYDGPPFATGLPHYGHILASTVKDAVPRYWTMKGFRVDRRWGWDCHGLPIENLVEEELKISGRKAIEGFGIKKFNETARSKVLTYAGEWHKTVRRIGRFVDFENSYKTMDASYMESVWWAFAALYKKGLVYKDSRTSLFCPRCETPLSNFEIAMDNSYRDQEDDSVYVRLPLKDVKNEFLLVWTTTPWTLPGNAAVAVNPKLEYIKFIVGKEFIWSATVPPHNAEEKISVAEKRSGKSLLGRPYEPPFRLTGDADVYRIVGADFVDTKEGTGLVHIAPAFGEEDFEVGKRERLPIFETLDDTGRFRKDQPALNFLAGKKTGEADRLIIEKLKTKDYLWKVERIVHRYPVCWRCQTPLLYKVQPAWFIKISALKPKMLALNEKIDWHPAHLKHGRFGNGLETAPDWNVSRSRFWGTPLPIWECLQCGRVEIIGGLGELKEKGGTLPRNDKGEVDLHRPYTDNIFFTCACGEKAGRIADVFDCWFESGSMPFASVHYPFTLAQIQNPKSKIQNPEKFPFPADFISEYIAQTRGWFYTLHVISTALFSKPAFKHVVTTGTILSKQGEKLSKSRKNFPDPWLILGRYGADAMRYYLMSSPVMLADNINFSEKDVDEIYKKYSLIAYNVLNFWKFYRNMLRGPQVRVTESRHVLDRWIRSRLHSTIRQVTRAYDAYEITEAARPLLDFVQDLSLWYVRRSRERVKSGGPDVARALATLRAVLFDFSRLTAPVTPFLAEIIYQDLGIKRKISVHLEDWPKAEGRFIKKDLEKKMGEVREAVSEALRLRAEAKIKVRQPLAKLQITSYQLQKSKELLDLLRDEVNVKEIAFGDELELNTILTPELKEEGTAREIIRNIQEMRRDLGLKPKDKIRLQFSSTKELDAMLEKWKKFIMRQAGVREFVIGGKKIFKIERELEFDGQPLWAGIEV